MRISVIDLGFNSVKLVNYSVASDLSFKAEEECSIKVRLGEGLSFNNSLNTHAMTKAIAALKQFREIIHLRKIRNILPLATSAVREASNQQEFLSLIQKETGFRFKVLSENEEALYSYIGASRAVWLPEAFFFDLGGGSLELVLTNDYKVKKIVSLPLGALRLSEKYVSRSNGVLSRKDALSLEGEINDSLPSSSNLRISSDIPLVGIGGSVRAIARYHQNITKYPLTKLHNYVMDSSSIKSIRKNLSKLGYNKIAKIDVVGKKRAYTITAASFVIHALMRKFEINRLIVSTHGLREGYLSEYIRNPLILSTYSLDIKKINNRVVEKLNPWDLPNQSSEFIHLLVNAGVITWKEYQIIGFAKKMLKDPFFAQADVNVLFELTMNETCPTLSHEDQLLLALSLMHRRKPKNAEQLYSLYSNVFIHSTMKSVRRVALCLDIDEILERCKSRVELGSNDSHKFILKILPGSSPLPEIVIKNKIIALEAASGIMLSCFIPSRQDRIEKVFLKP